MSGTATAEASSRPEFSLSVSRALRILSSFSQEQPEQSLTEISRSMLLSKGSTARFLQALEMHGYVDRDPQTRLYRPGPEAARVGSLYHAAGRLKQVAMPILKSLVDRFGFTSYLSSLRGDHMLILVSVEGIGPIKYTIPVGTKLPVHNTATGQAALARLQPSEVAAIVKRTGLPATTRSTITSRTALMKRLSEVRAHGYSVNWEERTVGVASVAAAVGSGDGPPVCILSLGFATSQIKHDQIGAIGLAVKAAAKLLSTKLDKKGIFDAD